jgi:septal ring factor EnvC (AmiA/AmiB activator)
MNQKYQRVNNIQHNNVNLSKQLTEKDTEVRGMLELMAEQESHILQVKAEFHRSQTLQRQAEQELSRVLQSQSLFRD